MLAEKFLRAPRIVIKLLRTNFCLEFAKALAFFCNQRREIHRARSERENEPAVSAVLLANRWKPLTLLFLCARLHARVAPGKLFDASGGVDELLFAGEKRMAGRANAYLESRRVERVR